MQEIYHVDFETNFKALFFKQPLIHFKKDIIEYIFMDTILIHVYFITYD